MKGIEKVFKSNIVKSNYRWVKDKYFHFHYVNYEDEFSGITIGDIIFHMNYLKEKYPHTNIPVWFELASEEMYIADKLTYIIFECLLYYFIESEHRTVRVFWDPKSTILTDGIHNSPIIHLNNKFSKSNFINKFLSDESNNHFRKVYSVEAKNNDPYYQSKIQVELDLFLKKMDIREESSEKISEICAELIGNTFEHAQTDCLLDIDLTNEYGKEENGEIVEGEYKGVNIALINFSDKLLHDDIKQKLHSEELTNIKYRDIMEAYNIHKSFFDNVYKEDYFYYLAATQLGISGRKNIQDAGGTGLYVLLSSLINDSDLSNCYVLSGNNIIKFHDDYLYENDEHWMCYNVEKDFINYAPDREVFGTCAIYFPGTAYNFNFVIEMEGSYE